MKFDVHLIESVSTTVTVDLPEGSTPDEIQEAAYQSDDMPGSIAHGAFGQVSVDESGDWEVYSITDVATGNLVWEKDPAENHHGH